MIFGCQVLARQSCLHFWFPSLLSIHKRNCGKDVLNHTLHLTPPLWSLLIVYIRYATTASSLLAHIFLSNYSYVPPVMIQHRVEAYASEQARQRYLCDFSKWSEDMQQRSADLINRLDRQMRHHTKYIAENPENWQGRPSALPEKDARKIFKLLGVTITHLQEVS